MNVPADLKYTRNDEWVRAAGNVGTIGITDYAQGQLSDIVFVEITVSADETIKAGDSVAAVESVKAAAEVCSPVSGAVAAVNSALPDSPEQVNSDAYGAAWMVQITLSDPAELGKLMDAAAYEAYCQEREG